MTETELKRIDPINNWTVSDILLGIRAFIQYIMNLSSGKWNYYLNIFQLLQRSYRIRYSQKYYWYVDMTSGKERKFRVNVIVLVDN